MVLTTGDTDGDRARLARSRSRAVAVLVVIAVAGLFWLAALTSPGNVEGVVILEALTAAAAIPVVLWLRRINARVRTLPGNVAPASVAWTAPRWASTDPVPTTAQPFGSFEGGWRAPPDELAFDGSAVPDLVLQPRALPLLVGLVALLAGPAALLWLQWNANYFDARTPLIVAYSVIGVTLLVRARIVVASGMLWRRRFRKYRPTSLDALATVRFGRARYTKREGILPFGYLRLLDRYGRRAALKPGLWTGSAAPLLAIVDACARSQGLSLDHETAERLRRPDFGYASPVPAWAYAPPARNLEPGNPPRSPSPRATRFARFWTHRNPDGTARKAQPQRLVPILALMALMLPVFIIVTKAGNAAMHSAHCAASRSLWTNAPDFPSSAAAPILLAQRLAGGAATGTTGQLFTLGPKNIANSHNTRAVRADAATLTQGFDVEWTTNGTITGEVQIETFPTHSAALQFQRDYAEDHCHAGDKAFGLDEIPGGAGFRCTCTGSTVSDRFAWVRGTTRVQAMVWSVPARQGHGRITSLAEATLEADKP